MCWTRRRASICLCCKHIRVQRILKRCSNIFLDEFGRILETFVVHKSLGFLWYYRLLVIDEKNTFVKLGSESVELVHAKGDTFTATKIYKGSVGTSPSCAFNPKDIAVDKHGSVLVAVSNDNAIHLLNKALAFQKLLMTVYRDRHRLHWTVRVTFLWDVKMDRFMS